MSFPPGFLFGISTSAYQVEGAWNKDGKGESIWDYMVHNKPEKIVNFGTGDIACDSYHKYKEDVSLIKQIGFDFYRFSISWTRILPEGDLSIVNQTGIDYYHKLIDELLENGIQPMVTIYHWDLPKKLQDLGGWTNPLIADFFEDYADLVFKEYGPKVKWWITINEPLIIMWGYRDDKFAPALNLGSPANYIVIYNILRAHARAYRLYDRKYRSFQNGKISISNVLPYYKSKTNSKEDLEATRRAWAFSFDAFVHPIFGMNGDFPELMKQIVDANSVSEGRKTSRLPKFTQEEVQSIKNSADFLAANFYITFIICNDEGPYFSLTAKDNKYKIEFDPEWPKTGCYLMKVVPWAFREAMKYVKESYGNPPVFVTENGYSYIDGIIDDLKRVNYFKDHLKELSNAINEDGCNVIGYTAWALMDNFEWNSGYSLNFGLVHVDFNDPERKRTMRSSGKFFQRFLTTKQLL